MVAVILVFGVAVPAAKGLGFFDPVLLAAYACLGIVFAGPAAAQGVESDRNPWGKPCNGSSRRSFSANCWSVAMLTCGVGHGLRPESRRLFPARSANRWPIAASFGMAASLALASLAAWVTVRGFRRALPAWSCAGSFSDSGALFYLTAGDGCPTCWRCGTLLSLLARRDICLRSSASASPAENGEGGPPDPGRA